MVLDPPNFFFDILTVHLRLKISIFPPFLCSTRMAGQTSPTLTSTSHTLTSGHSMAPASANRSSSQATTAKGDAALLERLQPGQRYAFLQPSAAIADESLLVVKDTLEAFAGQVEEEQQRRLKESRKRKRGEEKQDVLKTRRVYVEGFETEQVWEQAKRIIGGVLELSEKALEEMESRNEIVANDVSNGDVEEEEEEMDEDLIDEDLIDEDLIDEDDDEADEIEDEENMDPAEDDILDDDLEEELEAEANGQVEDDDEEDHEDGPEEEYVEDPNGLNDGFFSIDQFNRQSQWFEDQDARGDPNTDHASDDEEVDWTADPMAPSNNTKPSLKNKHAADEQPLNGDDENEDSDSDDGPTFGNMALDAPEGDSEDELMENGVDDENDDFNANEVYYKDFFAPPARKNKSGKPRKAKRYEPKQPDEADVKRAMEDVRRDLFDDESDNDMSNDALSDVSAGDPKSRRSAHERRQAKLAEEIRKLEAESVAKREWTLSGEAAAADRPMNSLLEEDLDFEHMGKPVPVITPEVSEGIEDLIKRRILAQEFDEVLRRRPNADSVPAATRRGLQELDDSKPNKSLAEVYEEEHVKNANPDGYVSKADEKLHREEREVEAMWKAVSAKLDALSSWHYKPKPAAPALSVVADVAAITMEDAQPATAQGVAGGEGSSRLAPQEIYAAGKDTAAAAPGELVSRSGLPVARQEMAREDKARRRRRAKERGRKAGDQAAPAGSRKAQERRDTMADLKKGGVKVINRKGEITDVEGNKAKAAKVVSSGSYKL